MNDALVEPARRAHAYDRRRTSSLAFFFAPASPHAGGGGGGSEASDAAAEPAALGPADDVLLSEAAADHRSVAAYLRARLARGRPCAWLGEVLLSLNPRRELCGYSPEGVARHRRLAGLGLPPAPHVYAVAQAAIDRQLRPESEPPLDQVICCLGESGSGKTEAARAALAYLAQSSVAAREGGDAAPAPDLRGSLEHRVIAANEVLDAFGGARLPHSSHSTRFGRSLQLQYNSHGSVVAAELGASCLESARVAGRGQGLDGGNFAVCFLLCAGASARERERQFARFQLDNDFACLKGGTDLSETRAEQAEQFSSLLQALEALGVDRDQQTQLWKCLTAIMYLGDLEVSEEGETSEDSTSAVRESPAADLVAELLDCETPWEEDQLFHAMCTAKHAFGSEQTKHGLNRAESVRNRDALAIALYDGLFAWLLARLNESLAKSSGSAAVVSSVWLLDLFGFETSETRNGFTQLCSNYTAEKLQLLFSEHSFAREEAALRREGVAGLVRGTSRQGGSGNRDAVTLFESATSPIGVFPILQDVGQQALGNEDLFHTRLQKEDHKRLEVQDSTADGFEITHFNERDKTVVQYTSHDFVDRNRSSLPSGLKAALHKSKSSWTRSLLQDSVLGQRSMGAASSRRGAAVVSEQQVSVSSTLQQELTRLLGVVERASFCHFVRCFSADSVSDLKVQLDRASIGEYITSRREGFCLRLDFEQVLHRWRNVCPDRHVSDRHAAVSELMETLRIPGEWEIGQSRRVLFLKAEAVRRLDSCSAIALLQPFVKGQLARQRVEAERRCVRWLQSRLRSRADTAARVTARFAELCTSSESVGECYRCFKLWFEWRGVNAAVNLRMQKHTNALLGRARPRLAALTGDDNFGAIQAALSDCRGAQDALPEYAALEQHRNELLAASKEQMRQATSSDSTASEAFAALHTFGGMRDHLSDEDDMKCYHELVKHLRGVRAEDAAELERYTQSLSDDAWDEKDACGRKRLVDCYRNNGMGLRPEHELLTEKQARHWEAAHREIEAALASDESSVVVGALSRFREYDSAEFGDQLEQLRERRHLLIEAAPVRTIMQEAAESIETSEQSNSQAAIASADAALRVYDLSREPVQQLLADTKAELQQVADEAAAAAAKLKAEEEAREAAAKAEAEAAAAKANAEAEAAEKAAAEAKAANDAAAEEAAAAIAAAEAARKQAEEALERELREQSSGRHTSAEVEQLRQQLSDAEEMNGVLEAYLDETRREYDRVCSELDDAQDSLSASRYVLIRRRKADARAFEQWRRAAVERRRAAGLFTAQMNQQFRIMMRARFRRWVAFVTGRKENSVMREAEDVELALRRMAGRRVRSAWSKFCRNCAAKRYARLQTEYVWAEKQARTLQAEVDRLHDLQTSTARQHHKRQCFKVWLLRTQRYVRIKRSAVYARARRRLVGALMRNAWRDWCRAIELFSWERFQAESDRCITQAHEGIDDKLSAVRLQAGLAIRGRLSALRTYWMCWQNFTIQLAREHLAVRAGLAKMDSENRLVRDALERWKEVLARGILKKKYQALLHRAQMREASMRIRAEKAVCGGAMRQMRAVLLSGALAAWAEFVCRHRFNAHAVARTMQRYARHALVDSWERWHEILVRKRLVANGMHKIKVRMQHGYTKLAFAQWAASKAEAEAEKATKHMQYRQAEAAFGRQEQANTRRRFEIWMDRVQQKRAYRQILARFANRRGHTQLRDALAQWTSAVSAQRHDAVCKELADQQKGLAAMEKLLKRNGRNFMLDPRVRLMRRCFTPWKERRARREQLERTHECTLRLQRHQRARAAFRYWIECIRRAREQSMQTKAQVEAKARELTLHGNGPKFARWWHHRCESVTKRVAHELTDLMSDCELYKQAVDLGHEWEMECAPMRQLSGRFWLQSVPRRDDAAAAAAAASPSRKRALTPKRARGAGKGAPLSPSPRLGNAEVYAASQRDTRPHTRKSGEEAGRATPERADASSPAWDADSSVGSASTPRRRKKSAVAASPAWSVANPWAQEVQSSCVFELRMADEQ